MILLLHVCNEWDVAAARMQGREVARGLGFGLGDATLVATAISEVAQNMVVHGGGGALTIEALDDGAGGWAGLRISAQDQGPGIAQAERAMEDGYSTVGSLGMGLPGAKRMMDAFELDTRVGGGTRVVMHKWLVQRGARGGQGPPAGR